MEQIAASVGSYVAAVVRSERKDNNGERRKVRHRPPRCFGMYDLGRNRSALDHGGWGAAVVVARDPRGKGTGRPWFHFSADLRQSHRLQTSAKPESSRYAGRSH